MTESGTLRFDLTSAVEAYNSGLFVSPGYGTHATRVIDSYELIFVTQGFLDMFEGEMNYHLECNQTLLLYPGRRHGGSAPFAPDANFYWVHFQILDRVPGDSPIRIPKIATVSDPEFLTELFCRFISDQESGTLDPLIAAHLVTLMLCEAGEPVGPIPVSPQQGSSLAGLIQTYIDENYRRPITTSSIARDLLYNSDYLERVYRRHAGISILDALHLKRIASARALLRSEGRKNINEIAFACGYTDPGYFRRMFKRLTGLTPKQFRSLYSRTHINTH